MVWDEEMAHVMTCFPSVTAEASPTCEFLSPDTPHVWPREGNSKDSEVTGASEDNTHRVYLAASTLWQPFPSQ